MRRIRIEKPLRRRRRRGVDADYLIDAWVLQIHPLVLSAGPDHRRDRRHIRAGGSFLEGTTAQARRLGSRQMTVEPPR
jgi:hypothetical protein